MKQPLAIFITDTHLSESTIEINKKIFDEVFTLAKSIGTKIIIHGGDIFTSRKGQPEVVALAWKNIIDEAAKKELRIFAIPGNHDKTNTTGDSSFLSVYDGHPAFSVLGAGAAFSHSDVDITFLPYYDEKLVYPQKLKQILSVLDKNRTNILITHVGIDGVRSNSGVLVDNDVTQDMFEDFNYVLIGHYHDAQILGSREHIIYVGSAYQANFGENDKKGCVIIYDDPIDPLEFVDLEFPKYITIEVIPSDIDKELVEMIKEKSTEAKVRVKIKGTLPEDKKPLLLDIQSVAKVEIEKDGFVPVHAVANQDLTMSSQDILDTFDQWSKERKIKSDLGRKMLQKVI